MSINAVANPVKEHKKEKKPLILAHRGLVTEYQENTLSAVRGAMESDKCDGCECDVFLTKDNQVVLFHDENLKRVTGVDRNIYEMTWKDLQTLTVQRNIEVDGGLRQYEKEERIPLLSEVLEEIKGKDFFINIELKAYKPRWSKRKTGREVAKVVRASATGNQAVCSSFDFFMLYSLEKENRTICSGFAYDDNIPLRQKWINWVMERNLIGRYIHSNIAEVEHTLIDKDSIAKYHNKNMNVGTYTLFPLTPIDKEDTKYDYYAKEVQRLARLGVDWIETDNPHIVHDLIHRSGTT
jgi:glycerophosphoryl diester phosphodiesterase